MAKQDFTYACGHGGWTDLRGPQKGREWKLRRLEGEMCPACWGAARIAAAKAEGAAAVAKVAASGAAWPALTGTEKQVAWAEQIRARAIVWLGEGDDEHHLGAGRAAMVRALAAVTSAAWFCDRARHSPDTLLEAALGHFATVDLRGWRNVVAAELAREVADDVERRVEEGRDGREGLRLRTVRRRVEHVTRRACHAAATSRSHRDPPTPDEAFLHAELWPAFVAELREELRGRGIEADTAGWEDEPFEEARP